MSASQSFCYQNPSDRISISNTLLISSTTSSPPISILSSPTNHPHHLHHHHHQHHPYPYLCHHQSIHHLYNHPSKSINKIFYHLLLSFFTTFLYVWKIDLNFEWQRKWQTNRADNKKLSCGRKSLRKNDQ